MKKFLPFLASLMLASVSWGQTGNGVILLTDASYAFTPTTVDSSATFNLSVQNDVAIAQTVFFGGLDAPFSLSSTAPVEIAASRSPQVPLVRSRTRLKSSATSSDRPA